MSLDSNRGRDDSDLERWYDGYLVFEPVSPEVARQLAELGKGIPRFDVSGNAIELGYRGRDSSRMIVRTLIQLARLVKQADGEVSCQISGDVDELRFEFYRIRDGRLFRQRAEVVRQPEHEVTEATL
jgi:hypothetical protein